MVKYKLAQLNDRSNDLTKQWYIEYHFQHPETKEWVRFRKYISNKLLTACARREKAIKLCRSINLWLKSGGTPYDAETSKEKTVKAALENILAIKKTNCRPRSYHTYKHVIKNFLQFLAESGMDNLRLDDMNTAIAQEFMDWTKTTLGIQNRTYNYYRMHMGGFFNEMVRRAQVDMNPFSIIKKLQVEETSIVAFKHDELSKVREKLRADDVHLYCCAGLIFYCALRPAEIMRLKIGDLFLDEGLIHISGGQSKNKKAGWVNIANKEFLAVLKTMNWESYPKDFFIFARHLKPGPKEAAPTRIAGYWRIWAQKNGITRNIYDLKHTAAGMAADNGVPMRDLQLHFRHSAIGITEKYLDRFRKLPGPGLIRYPSM